MSNDWKPMNLFSTHPCILGAIHLEPLPGAPDYSGNMGQVVERAVEDALCLSESHFDGIIVENYHDAPFFKSGLPPETISAITRCALAIRAACPGLTMGINALRNDALGALGIAAVVDAQFIRVNVLTGAMVTDQGLIEGCAASLIRKRAQLAPQVAIIADVSVKHAEPLAPLDLAQSARDTAYRGRADALIVSGSGTGMPVNMEELDLVRAACPDRPVFIGSGTTLENAKTIHADGFIVGTSLKKDGRINLDRARALRQALHSQ